MQVNKIAVIGSGVMGSGIAAQAANGGLDVMLLDIVPEGATDRNKFAKDAIEKQLKAGGFTHPKRAKMVHAGNLEDDLDKLAECDWIIEVVVEKLPIKQSVYQKIEAVRKEGSVVSSNTSTLPLATLIEGMPEHFKKDFMITHFFNPPRVMRLLEAVPAPGMDKKRFSDICAVADKIFGKTIVPAKDTPGFIANRIGVYWMTLAMNKALEHGIRLEEVDALMGRPIGVPKTAVFGLYDLIGIDLMPLIADAMRTTLANTDAFLSLDPKPPLLANMIADGYTGRKGKGGFYKMDKLPNGEKVMQAKDLSTGDYHPALAVPTLESAKAKNIKELLSCEDMGGDYARDVMIRSMHYAAALIPEIADDIADVDNAMKYGYSWKFGPFELIDQLGVSAFADYCKAYNLPIPAIIEAAGGKPLYSKQGSMTLAGNYQKSSTAEGVLRLADLEKPLQSNSSSKLWDMGDGVLCFEITTKMHTIDMQVLSELEAAVTWAEQHAKALVIGSDASLFSAGANIHFFVDNARNGQVDKVDAIIRRGQQVMQHIKQSCVPVVPALTGIALGGGCEMLLHAHDVQAHMEVRTGLVEVNVGVVPAWGGCKEMLIHHVGKATSEAEKEQKLLWLFQTILAAKTANSADEAVDLGIVKPEHITMNIERLLADTKYLALRSAKSHQKAKPYTIHLPERGAQLLEKWLDAEGGKLPRHTQEIAKKLIPILTNHGKAQASEQEILDLEREAFIALVQTVETQARIDYMLENGKPLMN